MTALRSLDYAQALRMTRAKRLLRHRPKRLACTGPAVRAVWPGHDRPFLADRHPFRHLQAQRRGDARAGRRPQGPHRHDAAGRRRGSRASAMSRAASCCRASGCGRCSIPARRSSSCRRWRRNGHVRRRRAGRGRDHRHRPGQRRECVIVVQRRHGEGRHLLPDDGEEASARAGDRRCENRLPCIYLVDSGGANLPQPGRGVSRPRAFRPHLLQPGQHVGAGHSADRLRDGLVHRRRRLCAGDVRRDRHRAQAGHDLPRRPAAGEGRDRRDRQRRGPGRRRRACPRSRASPTTTPTTTATRSASSARIVANLNRKKQPSTSLLRAARAALRRRGALRHRAAPTAARPTTCAR